MRLNNEHSDPEILPRSATLIGTVQKILNDNFKDIRKMINGKDTKQNLENQTTSNLIFVA